MLSDEEFDRIYRPHGPPIPYVTMAQVEHRPPQFTQGWTVPVTPVGQPWGALQQQRAVSWPSASSVTNEHMTGQLPCGPTPTLLPPQRRQYSSWPVTPLSSYPMPWPTTPMPSYHLPLNGLPSGTVIPQSPIHQAAQAAAEFHGLLINDPPLFSSNGPVAGTTAPNSPGDQFQHCFCLSADDDTMLSCVSQYHTGYAKCHASCVGMDTVPPHNTWICDVCKLKEDTAAEMTTGQAPESPLSDAHSSVQSQTNLQRGTGIRKATSGKGPWSPYEDDVAIKLMRDLKASKEGLTIDGYWERISCGMKEAGFERSGSGVKNQWNRRLRAKSGIDERATPKPGMLETGLLKKAAPGTPRKRRAATRVMKRQKTKKKTGLLKKRLADAQGGWRVGDDDDADYKEEDEDDDDDDDVEDGSEG